MMCSVVLMMWLMITIRNFGKILSVLMLDCLVLLWATGWTEEQLFVLRNVKVKKWCKTFKKLNLVAVFKLFIL